MKERESKGSQYFALGDALKYLKDGANVFALEAHSSVSDRVEFLLDPVLIVED